MPPGENCFAFSQAAERCPRSDLTHPLHQRRVVACSPSDGHPHGFIIRVGLCHDRPMPLRQGVVMIAHAWLGRITPSIRMAYLGESCVVVCDHPKAIPVNQIWCNGSVAPRMVRPLRLYRYCGAMACAWQKLWYAGGQGLAPWHCCFKHGPVARLPADIGAKSLVEPLVPAWQEGKSTKRLRTTRYIALNGADCPCRFRVRKLVVRSRWAKGAVRKATHPHWQNIALQACPRDF